MAFAAGGAEDTLASGECKVRRSFKILTITPLFQAYKPYAIPK